MTGFPACTIKEKTIRVIVGFFFFLFGSVNLVASGNHGFLGQEDFLGRNFDTEITASHHDTIGGFDNFIQIMNTLVVFDLRDDENVATLFACN